MAIWYIRNIFPILVFLYQEKSGVDVMITIFVDFRQFSANKFVCFFLNKQCYDPKLSQFCTKSPQIFGRKYF
jgi:hypothetical protein